MTKPKSGEVREDGKIYWSTRPDGRQMWCSPEAFERRCEYRRQYMNKRRLSGVRVSKEKQAQWERAYKSRNPQTRTIHAIRRGERIGQQAKGDSDFMRRFYLTRDRLTRCTGIAWHVDHIIALSRGGSHHENNLQVITAKLNLRKHCR